MPKIRKNSPHSPQKISKSGYEPFSRNNFFLHFFNFFHSAPPNPAVFARIAVFLCEFFISFGPVNIMGDAHGSHFSFCTFCDLLFWAFWAVFVQFGCSCAFFRFQWQFVCFESNRVPTLLRRMVRIFDFFVCLADKHE